MYMLVYMNTLTVIAEFLTMQFQSVSKANIPKVNDGLDSERTECERLLKAVSKHQKYVHVYE